VKIDHLYADLVGGSSLSVFGDNLISSLVSFLHIINLDQGHVAVHVGVHGNYDIGTLGQLSAIEGPGELRLRHRNKATLELNGFTLVDRASARLVREGRRNAFQDIGQ